MTGGQHERDDMQAAAAQIFTPEQIASGRLGGGRIMNFDEGWAVVIGSFGRAHYFRVRRNLKLENPNDKAVRSLCGQVQTFVNDNDKDQFGFLYGAGNLERCKHCMRKVPR